MTSPVRNSRQEQILDAALREILSGGVDSLSMHGLALASGLSRPAIYQYFASREHILAELLIDDLADLVNHIDSQLVGVVAPEDRVRQWVRCSLEYISTGEHSVLQEISLASLPEEMRGMVRAMHGQLITGLATAIAELGVQNHEVACGLAFGAVQQAGRRLPSAAANTNYIETVCEFVLAGILGLTD